MADYTPPSGDNVDFTFQGSYTAPQGDDVDFSFEDQSAPSTTATVTITSVSRYTIYSDSLIPGFDQSIVQWTTDINGEYKIEIGGTGAGTGEVLVSGTAMTGITMENTITDEMLEATTTVSGGGSGSYTISVYVKNDNDEWNPQE